MLVDLNSIVKLNIGLIISREKKYDNSGMKYRLLNYTCINDGIIDLNLLDKANLSKDIEEKFLTKEKDIVIKLSHPFHALLIDKENEGIVITANFCKITCLENVIPEYILACLNSNAIQKQLKYESKNLIINQIGIKDIGKLKIDLCDFNKQKIIADLYKNCMQRIQISRRIIEKEQSILKNIYK